MNGPMRRRDFITFLGGAATTWPLAARAQQSDRMRHIGVLMNLAADNPEASTRDAAFRQGLKELGWVEGRNLRIDYRWGAGDAELYRRYAGELVALAPEVILATAGPIVAALQRETRTVPIVFTTTIDPVALGYVASLARPGGNITGLTNIASDFGAKWLELLKEVAPSITRAAVLCDRTVRAGVVQFEAIQAAAPSFGVEITPLELRDVDERERIAADFARGANGGLIVTASTLATLHREQIIALAARHRLPSVYPNRLYVTSGGLMSYGPIFLDQYRRAAGYVDRILKGTKPADLPVQAATKYETVLNLKTANALGLAIPTILFARADQVIE
jgi:putative tryptophan/tyrosine transport system substrate-binding protein